MALNGLLADLHKVKGCMAGVMLDGGTLVAAERMTAGIDIDAIAAAMDDLFGKLQSAADRLGLPAATETVLHTPRGIVVAISAGERGRVRVGCLLARSGNFALAKLKMTRIAERAAAELAAGAGD